jgi:voltage-gated potassium channel Kch
MKAILIGTGTAIKDALTNHGYDVAVIDGLGTAAALRDAGVEDASLLVVTDINEATAIPIAKDITPDIRVIVYSAESMPEFVRGQVDLAVSPDLLSPDIIAEEIAGLQA